MQFGVCVATKIDDWQMITYAEELGYDRAWVPRLADDLVGLLRHLGPGRPEHLTHSYWDGSCHPRDQNRPSHRPLHCFY